jgi:Raf kinase inhibitor-like YbhB/YbcL family protein
MTIISLRCSKELIFLLIVVLGQSLPGQKSIHDHKNKSMNAIKISSSAFRENEMIPTQYTCDGKNINPPLDFKDIPKQAKSLALIVDDPDAPVGTWVHWVVWNIPVVQHLNENSIPGKEGLNDFQKQSYGGPCPPSGIHRYFFKVYALDNMLNLPEATTKAQLESAMKNHVLASGELIGFYKRKR